MKTTNILIVFFFLAALMVARAECVVTYTFDDGLADQYTLAYPMFREAGVPATFFIVGSKIGDRRGFRSKAERDTPLMTWEQVRDMAANGMEIASHGWAHVKYAKMDRAAILDDIRRNQSALKDSAGIDCVSFASPFGAKKGADGSDVESLAKECGILAVRASVKSAGGSMTAEKLNAIVEAAKNTGDWIVFMTHGIARGYDAWENPEELRRHLNWVKNQKDVRVLTFADAAKARTESRGSSTADDIARYESGGQLAADPSEVPVDAPKDMKLILCIGQSNMAGRAKPTDEDRAVVMNAYKLNRDNKWVVAKAPYHFDKKVAAVGPVDDFVRLYLKDHPGETVGVVPCAVGGSPLVSWTPGEKGRRGANLRVALERVKAAKANGKFIAVLWHQGETDAAKATSEQLAEYYPRDFKAMIEAVRREIGDVPVIAGEIGRWMRKDGDHAAKINPVINSLTNAVPNCAIASSEGLKNQDAHHFDREGQRVLAARYYEEFKKCAAH